MNRSSRFWLATFFLGAAAICLVQANPDSLSCRISNPNRPDDKYPFVDLTRGGKSVNGEVQGPKSDTFKMLTNGLTLVAMELPPRSLVIKSQITGRAVTIEVSLSSVSAVEQDMPLIGSFQTTLGERPNVQHLTFAFLNPVSLRMPVLGDDVLSRVLILECQ